MAYTENYDLFVTEPLDDITFHDYRTKMASNNNSNMTKIDEALTEKAEKTTSINTTLTVAGWGGSNPAVQRLTVSGIDSNTNGTISITHTATKEQRDAANAALLGLSGQGTNYLDVYAEGDVPTIAIPVTIVIT